MMITKYKDLLCITLGSSKIETTTFTTIHIVIFEQKVGKIHQSVPNMHHMAFYQELCSIVVDTVDSKRNIHLLIFECILFPSSDFLSLQKN